MIFVLLLLRWKSVMCMFVCGVAWAAGLGMLLAGLGANPVAAGLVTAAFTAGWLLVCFFVAILLELVTGRNHG